MAHFACCYCCCCLVQCFGYSIFTAAAGPSRQQSPCLVCFQFAVVVVGSIADVISCSSSSSNNIVVVVLLLSKSNQEGKQRKLQGDSFKPQTEHLELLPAWSVFVLLWTCPAPHGGLGFPFSVLSGWMMCWPDSRSLGEYLRLQRWPS